MAGKGRSAEVERQTGRVVIEGVQPEIDCGRFPIKRTVGEAVEVEADVFMDGHEALACALLFRKKGTSRWIEVPLESLVNDRWRASFVCTDLGRYEYTIRAWADPFLTWSRDLEKRIAAGQDIGVDLLIGAELVEAAAERAPSRDAARLERYAAALRAADPALARQAATDPALARLVALYPDRDRETRYERTLEVVVDPARARFSTWYEAFPRSTADTPGRHGTFADLERWLPRIADMGFDVLYLPPIHPIGRTFRKGVNNTLNAQEWDVGSPWAIGGPEGGHKDIHPDLGTLDDFRRLVDRSRAMGIDIALDIAFQASPDHPYVEEHPEWFRARPDGTIQYAENPPKKYQDIYPFDFETKHQTALYRELRSVIEFWVDQGVRVFRVDNPHTKPFPFWEWAITSLKRKHPELIFLSEAFTRPKVMYYLAKLGFTQSYTYFAWRVSKWDIEQYFTELTQGPAREFFRPNLWPNTPDILTETLQTGGRPAFMARLVLAATLGASYGIYGPPYELMEHRPRDPGSEEYLDSEKYQLRTWNFDRPDALGPFIAHVNRIRHENPALQSDRLLRFHRIDNDRLIAYSKRTPDLSNIILTVVNLDWHWTHHSWVELPLEELGLPADEPYRVHDLLSGESYEWRGAWNYVELNPHKIPAHIFRVEVPPAWKSHGE